MDGFDLKVLRMRYGIKQWVLAKHLDMSDTKLSRLETGQEALDRATMSRILGALAALMQSTKV